MAKITQTGNKTTISRWQALKKATSGPKLVTTAGLMMATALTSAGIGDVMTNQATDYRNDTSDLVTNMGKYVPLVGIPGMLGLSGVLALMSGMTSRFIYLIMGTLSFLKAKNHDIPLIDIARKINLLEKVQIICAKRIANKPLTQKDFKYLEQAQEKKYISDMSIQILRSQGQINISQQKQLEDLYAQIDQEQYSLIEQGGKHNGERGWFAQIYSMLVGLTWFTVLHDFMARKNTDLKPHRARELGNLQEMLYGVKDSSGNYIKGKEPLWKALALNAGKELKAPFLALGELWRDIKNPSRFINGFIGKDKKINEEAEQNLRDKNFIRKEKGKVLKTSARNTRMLIALSAGAPALIFHLLSLFGRAAGFGLALPWVNKYGTSIYNRNSPYYTEDNYYQDIQEQKDSPGIYNSYKAGEKFLENVRYISSISALTQGFNPTYASLYGGLAYTGLMTGSGVSYGLSGLLGQASPVMGQAFTILGTTLNMAAIYGGTVYQEYSKNIKEQKRALTR